MTTDTKLAERIEALEGLLREAEKANQTLRVALYHANSFLGHMQGAVELSEEISGKLFMLATGGLLDRIDEALRAQEATNG